MTRPLIGITSWRRTLPTDRQYSTDLDTSAYAYQKAVADAGGVPIIIPHTDPALVDYYLDLVDGLVMSGGDDVDPVRYRGFAQDEFRHDRSRDEHEMALVRGAKERQLPTLGICRGLQIAAVALGGTLVQDIPYTEDTHPGKVGEEELTWRHPVTVDPDTILATLVGTNPIVNSLHHQSVDKPGSMTLTASSPDGIHEAAEEGDWFLGVQWHPERLYLEKDEGSANIFAHLISRSS